MNTDPRKLTRQSLSGQEYQFEYIPTPIRLERDTNGQHNVVTEYRVRRGGYGTWTRWFKTRDIGNTIQAFGFIPKPNLLHDFRFESVLGRGEINLPKAIVSKLANASGMDSNATHLFSRLKRSGEDTWILPSSAVVDQDAYQYLKKLIQTTKSTS
jgi:hypothetical protein